MTDKRRIDRWTAGGFLLLVLLAAGVIYLRLQPNRVSLATARQQARVGCAEVDQAYRLHRSGIWLTLAARVTRTLPDSFGRYQHQRFLVRCASGLRVLIVNDVSVGQRAPVSTGDDAAARGQYIWNAQGGLLHYTHHDAGPSDSGWILARGKLYSVGDSVLPAAQGG